MKWTFLLGEPLQFKFLIIKKAKTEWHLKGNDVTLCIQSFMVHNSSQAHIEKVDRLFCWFDLLWDATMHETCLFGFEIEI